MTGKEGEERKEGRKAARDGDKEVAEVVAVDDDEVEVVEVTKAESDGALARRLAAEWAAEDGPGQKKADIPEAKDGKDESKLEPADIKPATKPDAKPNTTARKLHPMFARAQEAGPSRPREKPAQLGSKPDIDRPKDRKPTLTATRAQRVEPIDFDSDSLLFRPKAVDISLWPAGRLPYSVLVGVYAQVAGTRSRLTIVRVLTKCVPPLSR